MATGFAGLAPVAVTVKRTANGGDLLKVAARRCISIRKINFYRAGGLDGGRQEKNYEGIAFRRYPIRKEYTHTCVCVLFVRAYFAVVCGVVLSVGRCVGGVCVVLPKKEQLGVVWRQAKRVCV